MMTEENEPIKRQIGVVGDKGNEWRNYLYSENGILVGEKIVKLENGAEIPHEETGPVTHILKLPPNFESEDKFEVLDAKTDHLSNELVKTAPKNEECLYVKIFNQTKNIGEIHKLLNGVDIETKYFKIEQGKEVFCDLPPDYPIQGNFFAPIPATLDGPLSLYDDDGQLIIKIPHQTVAVLDGQTGIALQHEDESKVKKMLEKISSLSDEDKERLKFALENKEASITTLEGKQLSRTNYSEVEQAVDALLSSAQDLVTKEFYKTIDPFYEFGISRFVIDRFYHLPKLLSEPTLTRQPGTTTYIISSKKNDSSGNGICLEHRFQAASEQEATNLAKIIIKQLQGVQHKIWLGAWCLANELKKYTYTCALTELMRLCYPERTTYFQTKEKIEFYEHLKSLENTKIVFTRKRKKSSRSSKIVEDFIEIRALEISKGTRTPNEKYPDSLTITVLNKTSLQNEKMAFVGAGFKHRTLELHADDVLFAQEIQTRKNQKQQAENLNFDRGYLITLAGLTKTDKAKKSRANKLLMEKLQRLKDKGIIIDYPKRIGAHISLKVR